MKNRIFKFIYPFSLALAVSLFCNSCKEETPKIPEIKLSFQLEENQVFIDKMESNTVIDYILYGQKMNIQDNFFSITETIVDSIKEKSFVLSSLYKQQKLGMKISRDGNVESYFFDTAKPDSGNLPNEKMRAYFLKLLETPYSKEINKAGKITSTNIKQAIADAGGLEFQDGNLATILYEVIYPEYALKKGDKWVIEIDYKDSLGYAEGLHTFTLLSWTASTATIGVSTEYIYRFYKPTLIENKNVTRYGTYVVFRKTGWIKSGNIEENDITTLINKNVSEIKLKSKIKLENKVL